MENEKRFILGLDVSTKCIGTTILEDDGKGLPKIIAITHKAPKIPKGIDGLEALFLRKKYFQEGFLENIGEYIGENKITDVVIEEPLLSSNNRYTIATLLRFNGMIAEAVYSTLGIIPQFISSYDARIYSFPELVSVRKYNKKGEEYSLEHIKKAIKNNNMVLFGSYPFDIDKKTVMLNMVNSIYVDDNCVPWEVSKTGELRKENYDACDSLVCALAHSNILRYGLDLPKIIDSDISEKDNEIQIRYTTSIWDKKINKVLILSK